MANEWAGWADEQWNPITGCFRKDCHWCYGKQRCRSFNSDLRLFKNAESRIVENGFFILNEPVVSESGAKIAKPFGFEPTYHRYRFKFLDRKQGHKNLLVCQDGEMFGPWVSEKYIEEIFDVCNRHSGYNYIFRTTYPERYHTLAQKGILSDKTNFWYGVTKTSGFITERNTFLHKKYNRFISVTPILGETVISGKVDWVIIGADTRRGADRITPESRWITELVDGCRKQGIPVYTEPAVDSLIPEDYRQHDMPDGLKDYYGVIPRSWSDSCRRCGKIDSKKNMKAIMWRSKSDRGTHLLMYLCSECYEKFLKEYGLEEKGR